MTGQFFQFGCNMNLCTLTKPKKYSAFFFYIWNILEESNPQSHQLFGITTRIKKLNQPLCQQRHLNTITTTFQLTNKLFYTIHHAVSNQLSKDFLIRDFSETKLLKQAVFSLDDKIKYVLKKSLKSKSYSWVSVT